MREISYTALRANLAKTIDALHLERIPVKITRRTCKPVVILPYDVYCDLLADNSFKK